MGRAAGIAALVVAVVIAAILILGSDSDYEYDLLFETGGQLVPGNQVLVGGQSIGSIEDIELTEDSRAKIAIKVDQQLHEGTTAVVRAASLSGIANRYISISPGPNNAEEIAGGGVIPASRTTSPVDLDQLFDALNAPTRRALQKVIQGQGTIYTGNTEAARETYKYFAPGLQSTERLLAELTRDQQSLSRFLAEGSKALGAIAERRDDLSSLISNANQALGAIAERNNDLDRTLVELPPFMRQANTTFVNLREALDDLDPLVADSKVATRNLAPFLRHLQSVTDPAIPVFGELTRALRRPGPDNDLTDALRLTPGVERAAHDTVSPTLTALDDAQPNVEFAVPYTPELLAFLGKLGQVTAYYDANGHYARVLPAAANLFRNDSGSLVPIPTDQQFDQIAEQGLGPFTRCPGGSTQANPGWPSPTDHPFLGEGVLQGACDPRDVPPGS